MGARKANAPGTRRLVTASPAGVRTANVGAVFDWRYKRRGGLKPIKNDRVYFFVAVLFAAMLVILLGIRGSGAEALGLTSAFLTVLLLALWEIGR
jgi:hypothetical protein